MDTDNKLKIKTISLKEMAIPVEWANEEGWNPGLNDAACYFNADPNGFLLGYMDDEPVASISVVRYDDSFAFLGFYIVRPQYRGLGLGMQIWRHGLDYLNGCNIALDGVVAQQENYKKSGFKLAYRNIRFAGTTTHVDFDNANIVDLTKLPFDQIAAFDSPFFPVPRQRFLDSWINQVGHHALGLVLNDQLTGYGVIRPCREGYKVGPLYAQNSEQATILFRALTAKAPQDQAVFLDVPENNHAAVTMAENFGMSLSFETARMYTGEFPDLPFQRIFGVTSFEIG